MAGIVLAHAIDVMDRPWKWGEADCCTSACDVYMRLTGVDPMRMLRGRYDSERGAMRIIASYGGFLRMCDSLAAQAGSLERPDSQPGDLAVCAMPSGGFALTICTSPGMFVGKTLTGLTTVRDVVRCYRA